MGQRSDEVRWDTTSDSRSADYDATLEVSRVRDADLGSDATGTEDTEQIRAEIDQTRAEMSSTIDAITERLNPTNIKEQVKDQVMEQVHEVRENVREATIGRAEDMVRHAGETVTDARESFMETIRQNPIPAALTGLGLVWLFMNRESAPQRSRARYYETRPRSTGRTEYYGGRGSTSYTSGRTGTYSGGGRYSGGQGRYQEYGSQGGYQGSTGYYGGGQEDQGGIGETMSNVGERAGDIAGQARDTVTGAASQARDTVSSAASQVTGTVSNAASQVQETAGEWVDEVQYRAQRLEDRFQETLYRNPLAVAAATLALGAAVGFALPTTRRESELMGEARDSLVEKAQEVASTTMEKVQQVASNVADQAGPAVSEAAREVGQTVRQEAGQAAREGAREVSQSTSGGSR